MTRIPGIIADGEEIARDPVAPPGPRKRTLMAGDAVQVIAPNTCGIIGMLGTVVDPAEYTGVPDGPDAGGVPVVFTYADERGGVRLVGRLARERLHYIGRGPLIPHSDHDTKTDDIVTVPDQGEVLGEIAEPEVAPC